MNQVLYEASFQFDFTFLIPIIMMIVISFFPFVMKKNAEIKGVKYNPKFVKWFCSIAFVFVFLCLIIALFGQINLYQKTVGEYKKGNYEIVEGYVENFDPMPSAGHKNESFEIDGVLFSYSDYSASPGYHNAKSHGGVITGDGQHLKIGYVYYNSSYGNIIVYIEKLP